MKISCGVWRQLLVSTVCNLSVLIAATSFFWLEPLMERLLTDEIRSTPMTSSETSWLVAIVELGGIIVTAPSGLLADRYGRKWTLLTLGPACIFSWILVLSTDSIIALYAARLIQGAAAGLVYIVAPMYIAEMAEPHIRGRLSGIFQVMCEVGMLFVYATGAYLSYTAYIYVLAAVPTLFTVLFYFMPESPYYYLIVGKRQEAKQALRWLRGKQDVDSELEEISQSIAEDMARKGGWKDLIATRRDTKILLLVQLICAFRYLIGTPALNSYAASTFVQVTQQSGAEHRIAIIMGCLASLSAVGAAFLSDSVGRRPLMVWSLFFTGICNSVAAAYFYLQYQASIDVSDYSWVMYVAVAGTFTVPNLGIGPLLMTAQAEMFPSNTRAIGGSVTGFTGSVATFLDLKQFQIVIDLYGMYMNFVIFAVIAFIGTVLMYLTVSETAGKSLGEIQQDFNQQDQSAESK